MLHGHLRAAIAALGVEHLPLPAKSVTNLDIRVRILRTVHQFPVQFSLHELLSRQARYVCVAVFHRLLHFQLPLLIEIVVAQTRSQNVVNRPLAEVWRVLPPKFLEHLSPSPLLLGNAYRRAGNVLRLLRQHALQ